ncbi:MAG: hypothetical protein ACK58L_04785, partial [Planctomycetota bacterium]
LSFLETSVNERFSVEVVKTGNTDALPLSPSACGMGITSVHADPAAQGEQAGQMSSRGFINRISDPQNRSTNFDAVRMPWVTELSRIVFEISKSTGI